MKKKIDRRTGIGLLLSGIIASHVLTLCGAVFSAPSAVCSLPEQWCAGNHNANVPAGTGKVIVFAILGVCYLIRRIRKSRPSSSTIEKERRQAFERESEKIRAEEVARQQEKDRLRSLCPQCYGKGMDQKGILCPRCHGKGTRQVVVCGVCEGRGISHSGSICPNCGGLGQHYEN